MPDLNHVKTASTSQTAEPLVTENEGTTELFIPPGLLPDWLANAIHQANTGDMPGAMAALSAKEPDHAWWAALTTKEAKGYSAFVTACIYLRAQRPLDTELWFERACEVLQHPLVLNEAARFFSQQGRRDRSISLRREALTQAPAHSFILANLGDDLIAMGEKAEGFRLLAQAVKLAPENPVIRSMWLADLHYQEELDGEQLFKEHRQWGKIHGGGAGKYCVTADPDRPLRLGYVSSDYHRHSVSYLFEPLLDARTRDQFTMVGYGNVSAPDEVTQRLVSKFDLYRSIMGMDDGSVAKLVQQDQIDILIDLGGHFGGHRLGVFAQKPAPVQVTYIGYPDTTGLSEIDYRLTDPWADEMSNQAYYTERLWFLQGGFLCYRPSPQSPAVGPLPVQKNGFVTFGSFNNNCKITQHVLDLWCHVLQAVPDSRMVIKFKEGDQPALQKYYKDAFAQRGIGVDRIELWGWRAREAHLAGYNRIDIALDTFPYNGTVTTCESLWMGVPVISLCGTHHASRVGMSLLSQVGLPFCVADTDEAYVQKAVALCKERKGLAKLRQSLRTQMLASPLCDPERLIREVEKAYRLMWRQWCRGQT